MVAATPGQLGHGAPLADQDEQKSGDWQGIRHQLFGAQREREAENELIAVLTQFHTKLSSVVGARSGPLRSPALRTGVLKTVLAGANALIVWHRDQVQEANIAAGVEEAPPRIAAELLAQVQRDCPLLGDATIQAGIIECADVIEGVGQLQGEESDIFFNEALGGLLEIIKMTLEYASLDGPTAAAVVSLEQTWTELVGELEAFACPVESQPLSRLEHYAGPAMREPEVEAPAARPVSESPFRLDALLARDEPEEVAEPEAVAEPQVLRNVGFLALVGEAEASPAGSVQEQRHEPVPHAEERMTDIAVARGEERITRLADHPRFTARFARLQLVGC